ncbi:MAG: hypothetical protein R3D30_03605 [Hyphomicrobiales bacterium]
MASGTTVSGGTFGMFAKQYGGGALTVAANGNVTAGTYSGIISGTLQAATSMSPWARTARSRATAVPGALRHRDPRRPET